MERRYYVYVIKSEGRPMYVGKGNRDRCMAHMERDEFASLRTLQIEVTYCETEERALQLEALLIDCYGLDNLINKKSEADRLPPDVSTARCDSKGWDALSRHHDQDANTLAALIHAPQLALSNQDLLLTEEGVDLVRRIVEWHSKPFSRHDVRSYLLEMGSEPNPSARRPHQAALLTMAFAVAGSRVFQGDQEERLEGVRVGLSRYLRQEAERVDRQLIRLAYLEAIKGGDTERASQLQQDMLASKRAHRPRNEDVPC